MAANVSTLVKATEKIERNKRKERKKEEKKGGGR